MRGEGLVHDKNRYIVPTKGGMPGQELAHKYQQRLTQAAVVKGQSDKIVIEEARTKTSRGLLFVFIAVVGELLGVIAGW